MESVYVKLPMYILAWSAVQSGLELSLGTLYVYSLMIEMKVLFPKFCMQMTEMYFSVNFVAH